MKKKKRQDSVRKRIYSMVVELRGETRRGGGGFLYGDVGARREAYVIIEIWAFVKYEIIKLDDDDRRRVQLTSCPFYNHQSFIMTQIITKILYYCYMVDVSKYDDKIKESAAGSIH